MRVNTNYTLDTIVYYCFNDINNIKNIIELNELNGLNSLNEIKKFMLFYAINKNIRELKDDCENKFGDFTSIKMKISRMLENIQDIEKTNEENYDKLNEFKYEYDYKLKNTIEKYDYKYNLLEKKVYNLLIIFVIISLYNAFNSILYKTI